MRFEEEYEDVLQNLEWGIVRIFREHPETTDYAAMDALAALRRHYIREVRGQETRTFNLTERAQQIFDSVKLVSEWRLGRARMFMTADENAQPLALGEATKTVNEIIDCIKRIEHSVKRWNKHGGRQGYLTFIARHIPGDALHLHVKDSE